MAAIDAMDAAAIQHFGKEGCESAHWLAGRYVALFENGNKTEMDRIDAIMRSWAYDWRELKEQVRNDLGR